MTAVTTSFAKTHASISDHVAACVPLQARRKFLVETRRHDHEGCSRYLYGAHVFVIDSMPEPKRADFGVVAPFPMRRLGYAPSRTAIESGIPLLDFIRTMPPRNYVYWDRKTITGTAHVR